MKKLILLLALMIPSVHAEIYDIKDFKLEQFLGKVVYLDFWASWCKPCQKSFPWMNELQQKFPADKFTVVTINVDENTEAMHDFLRRVPADFDIFHDPEGKLAAKFELDGMPTSFLINKQGKLVRTHIGFFENKIPEYEREIQELL